MLNRRLFAQSSAAALLHAQSGRQYRAVIIGHTGRGNYGHDWDTAFKGFPNIEVLAVADPDDAGRRRAKARSGAARDYPDYREMLDREKPNLVAVCPRWLDQRVPMVTAAAEHGAHVLLEKPFARDLEDADRMVAAVEKHGVKVQVGHTARLDPVVNRVRALVREGGIGSLMEIRARGKEDRRAGGEDLMVLGTHCFDLMRLFAGYPQWVFAHVTQAGRETDRGSGREATEPVGPIAGDNVAAMFAFSGGVHGYFGSKASDVPTGSRYGLSLYGSRGVIYVPITSVPNQLAQILRTTSWAMENGAGVWERIEPPPEALSSERSSANAIMVRDLLDAIERDREPACGARDGRWAVEMVVGVYGSQISGGLVPFPLADRRHPLG